MLRFGSGSNQIDVTIVDNVIDRLQVNTTYNLGTTAIAGGANVNLTGSDSTTDAVPITGSGNTTVSRLDGGGIQISSSGGPGGALSEWNPTAAYAIGTTFFTTDQPASRYPSASTHNKIYRVVTAILADSARVDFDDIVGSLELIGDGTGTPGSTIDVNGVTQTNPDFLNSTANRGIAWTAIGNNITGVAGADSTKQDNLSTSQLNVVNANPFDNDDVARLAAIQPFALDTTTQISDAKIPSDIARDNELINDLQINNTILEAFSSASSSTPVASVSLGSIGAPVEYVFDTITARDSGLQSNGVQLTGYPERVIYATVTNDSVTDAPRTTTTFWVLIDRPSSGATTADADWSRLGTPGVEVSSVIGCVYDPDDDLADQNGFVPVQLGTEDTTEGISEATADTLYYQIVNNLSEINTGSDEEIATKRTAAQTNLDVPPSEEIVQVNARLQAEIENNDPFRNVPHEDGYTYTADSVLTGNGIFTTTGDFYNSLGLFLEFTGTTTSVPEGSVFYIFNNGDASGGVPDLVIRRNSISGTALNNAVRLSFNVVSGFSFLEQFLAQPDFPGSSTRDLDISASGAQLTFGTFYTRDSRTQASYLERTTTGEEQFAHANTTVSSTDTNDELSTALAVYNYGQTILGETTSGYSDVGGFAVENLGSVSVASSGNTNLWPTGTSGVFGMSGIPYSAPNFTNETGGLFLVSGDSVIDVDITVVSTSTSVTNQGVTITAGVGPTDLWSGTVETPSSGKYTVRLTKINGQEFGWANSVNVAMAIDTSNSFAGNVHIDAVRWSLDGSGFTRIAGGVSSSSGDGPFSGFTFTNSGDATNSVPKWASGTTLTWSPDNTGGGSGDVSSVTGGNGLTNRGGNTDGAVILDIDNPYTPPSGIQRITTNLPSILTPLPNSTTATYWIIIDTLTGLSENIAVMLHGFDVQGLLKPSSPTDNRNTHLGVGENYFTFTLNTNQVTGWNNNVIAATPSSDLFEVVQANNRSNVLASTHDDFQYTLGGARSVEHHFISPDGTQTGSITFDNNGDFRFDSTGTGNVITTDSVNDPTPEN